MIVKVSRASRDSVKRIESTAQKVIAEIQTHIQSGIMAHNEALRLSCDNSDAAEEAGLFSNYFSHK
jgi:hypothetical protein